MEVLNFWSEAVWYQWLIWGFFSFYFIGIGTLIIGVWRVPYSRRTKSDADLPTVTVLVSARNEESDFPDCIDSLLKLDYPDGKLQIILVNDRSTDRTGEIVDETARKHPHVLALHTSEMGESRLDGKARGIGFGFRHATGEWVAITDADAEVHPFWLRNMLNDMPDEVGLTGGSLVVEGKGLIGKIERISWGFVQMFNVGATGLGTSIVCVGPNMMVRRSIYENAGGLEAIPFRVAEDLAIHEMVVKQNYKIKSYMDPETTVTLKPVPSWKHLFSQQRRWFGGGLENKDYKLPLWLAFGIGFLWQQYILFGWLLGFTPWAMFMVLKALFSMVIYSMQARRMNLKNYASLFWLFEVYCPIVFTFIPASFVFSKSITWKGEGYSIKYN